MKLRNFHILIVAFVILSPSVLLSGCTNPPALSQTNTANNALFAGRKGQKCHVEFHLTDSRNLIANGTFKEIDEQWLVLENVTEFAQAMNPKSKNIKYDYFIIRQSVVYISFDKP